jgi:hypothetical protein
LKYACCFWVEKFSAERKAMKRSNIIAWERMLQPLEAMSADAPLKKLSV